MRPILTLPVLIPPFLVPALLTPVFLAGCAGGSPLPGKVPADALSSMYTTTPAQQVATCIAQVVGGSAESQGAGYNVTSSSGTSYSVGPNDSKSVYPVQVVVRGTTVLAQESERVALCLRATSTAT